jgi:hypothetical protein
MQNQRGFIYQLKWLYEKYHNLQCLAEKRYPFKILAIDLNNKKQKIARIQITGKAVILDIAVQEIASNDVLLQGFSHCDVRSLAYHATTELAKPQYKITAQTFISETSQLKFTLTKTGTTNTVIEKFANEISLDKDLLLSLSKEDVHVIGYVTASEQITSEHEQMKNFEYLS